MVRSLCVFRWGLLGMLITLCIFANAQSTAPAPILFKKPIPSSSLTLSAIDPANGPMKLAAAGNQTKVFLQFQSIPDSRKQQVLKARGIDLLAYIPENTFLANVKGKWSAASLKEIGITATIPFTKTFKQGDDTGNGYAKSSANNYVSGKYHLVISPEYDSNQVKQLVTAVFKEEKFAVGSVLFLNKRLAEMELSGTALEKILDQPFVLYAMPARKLVPLNRDATDNLLGQAVQRGGNSVPGLLGKGVVMGVGDEGRVDHIDNGYNEEGQDYNAGYHSAHVAGTMVGAGIVNPIMKGFAPKATLLVDFFNNIIYRAPQYYQEKRMVLTNNSYGAGSYCVPYSGEYSGYSGQADQQLLDYPNMMHVFAAGNSGDLQCGNFPMGYRSIDNSFQAAKNVITVGGTSHDGLTNKFSRGPVNDGRIKPEISGIGNNMLSTIMGNGYGSNQGTSMSAPQITGALALVYERYRQLNGDIDPPGDLAKAIICNTATDIGTKGVDFSTGFGWLNLQKAIEVVNNKSYRSGTVEHNQEQTIEINLDKEVFDFKLMLYWHDQPSSYYTLKNLVNDLDLTVTLPDGSVYDPFVLDTSATGVTKPAVMGKDHMNNIEQVVIEHAFPGRYTIKVKGYKVPFGPQAFKIVYNWQEPGLQLMQPLGGEMWKPGEMRGIHWQDAGHDGDVYSFDYSLDNGASWINIPGITGTYNRVDWTLPSVQSAAARIRITYTSSGSTNISNPFVILPDINFSLSSTCSSEVLVKWSKPAGIDSVAVLLYQAGEYVVQTISADSSWVIKGLRSGPAYWISLQPILQGKTGERSIGQEITTPAAVCLPGGSSGDMAIKFLLLPPTGREGTSNAPVGPVPIKLQLLNTGNTIISDSIFMDIIKEGSLLGKDTLVKNFTAGEEYNWTTKLSFLPSAGSVTKIEASIIVAGDTNLVNNKKDSSWRFIVNAALALPYTEEFSLLIDSVYEKPGITGTPGAEHWDFLAASAAVHLETGNGFKSVCKIGEQSLALTGTFNLSGYQLSDNIRVKLDIPSRDDAGIEIYIRGSDASPWLLLPIPDAISGIDDTKNLDVSGVLAKANQNFTSSFQIKLVGSTSSYLFDLNLLTYISIFTTAADLALVDLNYTQGRVTDGDSMHILVSAYNKKLTTNGPFSIGLKTPDGKVSSLSFDSLGANKTASAPFTIKVLDWPNAVSPITAWVQDPLDTYPDDDSLQATIAYYRKISQFPYLEGFEAGEAGWGRTFLYALSDKLTESVAPFTAANGKNFWGTRRVNFNFDVAYPVSAGYLVSPLFDISALTKPWLSMSVNKQLCDGMDSVVLEYSQDTGRTWKSFPAGGDTKNWYDSPGQRSWKNCGNDYWQVVSTPLPVSGTGLMVRVLLSGANSLADEFPRLPGGLLVDDVHIFDLTYPVFDDKKAVTAPVVATKNGLTYFTENGKAIAAAGSHPAGNKMQLSAPMADPNYQGNRVLPKSWFFNGQPGATAGSRVRLYFSHDEIMTWLSAILCDTCQRKRSPYDLAVYRYAGPDALVNASTTDNSPGFATTFPPAAFDLVPYEAGYYAELPVEAYGEFYIGLDEKGSEFNFTAERQDGADIVLLNWNLTSISGISHFEVERASKTEGTLVFEKIGTVQALSNALDYRFRDIRINAPGSWHYRLKIIYDNGDIRYSPLRTISFERKIIAKVYPNPSTDGKVSLLLQNTEGKKVDLALYDQGGRLLWHQALQPVVQQQLVPLVAGDGRLPNGVYVLKISTESEKMSIQLVISRN